MNNDCLVLLTKVYPFDKGEEFIEREIPVLAHSFHRIILIATSTADQAVQTRQVPENVEVHQIKASSVQRKIPVQALSFFPFTGYRGLAGPDERAAEKGSLKKKAFLTYFSAKAMAVYRLCSKILENCNLAAFDAVTYYSYWLYDTAAAAIKLREQSPCTKTKTVSRAHRYDLYASRNAMNYLPLRYYILQHLDGAYPCSEDGSRYLKHAYPSFQDKIHTAYLGTEDYGLGPTPQGGTLRIVSCCHISPVKRVELLAQSLSPLKGSGLSLSWTHFGAGEGLDALRSYAEEHLSFMEYSFPGSVPNAELMQYYQEYPVDLFINTSSSEGLPVSIIEACSFGIPSIATNVGGTSEIVKESETGFLLEEAFAPQELADLILFFSGKNKEELQALRSRCRSLWKTQFDAKQNFERFAQEIKPE